MATLLLVFLILLPLSLSSFVLPLPETFQNAVDVLSDSGFLSMALTLQLVYPALTLNSSAATIFAPSDAAFIQSGQPSLLLLQYHISPSRLDTENLKALPFGARIPTLLLNRSLIITASPYDDQLSINNVDIDDSPIYDDGSMVVYGIEEFLNSSFQIYRISAPEPSPSSTAASSGLLWHKPSRSDVDSFALASNLLMSRGYSRMATFLDMQLAGYVNYTGLTIFAPVDDAIDEYVRNFSDFSLIFRRHVVRSCLTWTDLIKLESGTTLPTFSEGFLINVTRSGDILELNGLPVIFPDIYSSNLLVVHGLNRLLTSPERQELTGDSFFEFDRNDEHNPSDYDEY